MGSTEALDLGKRNKSITKIQDAYLKTESRTVVQGQGVSRDEGSLINGYRAQSGRKEGDLGLDGGGGCTTV